MKSKEIAFQVLFISYWQIKIDKNIPDVQYIEVSSINSNYIKSLYPKKLFIWFEIFFQISTLILI